MFKRIYNGLIMAMILTASLLGRYYPARRTAIASVAAFSSSTIALSTHHREGHNRRFCIPQSRRHHNQSQRHYRFFHFTCRFEDVTSLTKKERRISGIMEAFPASASYSMVVDDTNTGSTSTDDSSDSDESPANNELTKTSIRKMKVRDMQTSLSNLGLRTDGKRDILLARLLDNYNNSKSDATATDDAASIVNESKNKQETTSTTSDQEATTSSASSSNGIIPHLHPELTYRLQAKGITTQNSSGAGIGLVLLNNSTENNSQNNDQNILWQGRVYVTGNRTSFEAEYSSIIIGIKYMTEILKVQKLIVQLSHEPVTNQLNGIYDINKPSLKIMRDLCKTLIQQNEEEDGRNNDGNQDTVLKECTFEDIPLGENEIASDLATKALATRKSVNIVKEFQINDPIEILKKRIMTTTKKTKQSTSNFLGDTSIDEDSILSSPSLSSEDAVSTSTIEANSHGDDNNENSQLPKNHRWNKADDPAHHEPIDSSRDYLLRFDGGSRGNPGIAGAGMVIYDDQGKEVWCGWKYHGEPTTNNVAEYLGMMYGIKCAKSFGITKLIVEGDSQLVVRQITGQYRCREATLRKFRDASLELIDHFDYFEIRHIPRAENSRADWLANHAMDLRESHGFDEDEET